MRRPEAQLGPAMEQKLADGLFCASERVSDWLYFPQIIVNVHLALLSTASWYAVMIAFLHSPCNQVTNQKFRSKFLQVPSNLGGAPVSPTNESSTRTKAPCRFRASFGLFEWFRSFDGRKQSSRRCAGELFFEASMRCESQAF